MDFSSRNRKVFLTRSLPHLHDERVVLAAWPEIVDLRDALVTADLLVEEEFNVLGKHKKTKKI